MDKATFSKKVGGMEKNFKKVLDDSTLLQTHELIELGSMIVRNAVAKKSRLEREQERKEKAEAENEK